MRSAAWRTSGRLGASLAVRQLLSRCSAKRRPVTMPYRRSFATCVACRGCPCHSAISAAARLARLLRDQSRPADALALLNPCPRQSAQNSASTPPIQSLSELAGNLRTSKRFQDNLDSRIEPSLVNYAATSIPGGVKHLQERRPAQRRLSESGTIHAAGEHDICKEQPDLRLRVEQFQSARTIFGS